MTFSLQNGGSFRKSTFVRGNFSYLVVYTSIIILHVYKFKLLRILMYMSQIVSHCLDYSFRFKILPHFSGIQPDEKRDVGS